MNRPRLLLAALLVICTTAPAEEVDHSAHAAPAGDADHAAHPTSIVTPVPPLTDADRDRKSTR